MEKKREEPESIEQEPITTLLFLINPKKKREWEKIKKRRFDFFFSHMTFVKSCIQIVLNECFFSFVSFFVVIVVFFLS